MRQRHPDARWRCPDIGSTAGNVQHAFPAHPARPATRSTDKTSAKWSNAPWPQVAFPATPTPTHFATPGSPTPSTPASPLETPRSSPRHADPGTTEHYDRARGNLDRHGVHFLTAYVAGV
jgi:hypothetical protein